MTHAYTYIRTLWVVSGVNECHSMTFWWFYVLGFFMLAAVG